MLSWSTSYQLFQNIPWAVVSAGSSECLCCSWTDTKHKQCLAEFAGRYSTQKTTTLLYPGKRGIQTRAQLLPADPPTNSHHSHSFQSTLQGISGSLLTLWAVIPECTGLTTLVVRRAWAREAETCSIKNGVHWALRRNTNTVRLESIPSQRN